MLTLRLLGPIQIEAIGAEVINLRSHKALALLGYLAAQPGPTSRAELLALLWPDKGEEEARNNLSWVLSHINRQLPGGLHTDRLYIALHPPPAVWVDVRHVHTLAAQPPTLATLTELSALYRGEFLAGLELSGCAGFELWLTVERERQQQRLWRALDQLTAAHIAAGAYAPALETAYRLLALDEWQEKAHQHIMWLLAATGRRSQALEQYARCRNVLQTELGLSPSAETEALRRQIMDDEHVQLPAFVPEPPATPFTNPPVPPPHSLTPAPHLDPALAILGDKVERAWLQGVLAQAAPPELSLQLPWVFQPQAVARPWTGVIEAELYNRPPAGTTWRALFDSLDRALLILGAAGVGKTITLLQLGRELLHAARSDPDQPMPVVLNLSTWGEAETTLADWLVKELTTKYQIPRPLGEAWLEQRRLVVLLDGLDELPAAHQPACVTAINTFRTRYGLVGLAVCCRDSVYETYPQPLQLAGAIQLQPLQAPHIEAYAQARGVDLAAWQTLADPAGEAAWQPLLRLPLMLSLICQLPPTPEPVADSAAAPADRQQAIIQAYVARMFQRRDRGLHHTPAAISHSLAWLAHALTLRRRTLFMLEDLQPAWLPTRRQRWLYLLGTRLFMGLLVGAALVCFQLMRRQLFPDMGNRFYGWAAGVLGLAAGPLANGVTVLLLSLVAGGLAGLADIFFLERASQEKKPTPASALAQAATVGVLVLLVCGGPFAWLDNLALGLSTGLLHATLFLFALGYLESGPTYFQDVRTVERLDWEWRSAGRGALAGLLLGGLLGWIVRPRFGDTVAWSFVVIFCLAVALLRGLRRGRLERHAYPNQGFWLSLRNAALAAALFGLGLGGLLTIWYWPALHLYGLFFAAYLALFAAGVYGGNDMVKHAALRFALWWNGATPWNWVRLLDEAVQLTFLRQVGGGYLFHHQLFQTYFDALYDQPSP